MRTEHCVAGTNAFVSLSAFLMVSFAITARPPSAQAGQTAFKFDFGPGPAAPGYVRVLPDMVYSKERGYGFEPGADIRGIDRKGPDSQRSDFCTSDKPFYFSVALPEEGNYRVTVTLGDETGDSTTTIKAELRRLMVERVQTTPGGFATRTFIVNIRTPKIEGDGEVRLKAPRETTQEAWDWDKRLTLEFNNTRPCVCALEIQKVDVPTVFILGDSTVCDQSREPYCSWGQMLPRFFKPEVAVANHAESGETFRDSIARKRLAKILSLMKPGDYLFMQFGHNDQKERGEGIGAFLNYTSEMNECIAEARQKGGIPVLITPMNRRTFDADGRITNSLGEYPAAVRQTAQAEHVALIDLNAMSKVLYEAWGPKEAPLAFAGYGNHRDGTHHDNYGAYELAKCVVAGIEQDHLGLATHIVNDFHGFDPAHPDPIADFDVPPSPLATDQKPYGN